MSTRPSLPAPKSAIGKAAGRPYSFAPLFRPEEAFSHPRTIKDKISHVRHAQHPSAGRHYA